MLSPFFIGCLMFSNPISNPHGKPRVFIYYFVQPYFFLVRGLDRVKVTRKIDEQFFECLGGWKYGWKSRDGVLNREHLAVDFDRCALGGILQKILKRLAVLGAVFDFEPGGCFVVLVFGVFAILFFHGGLAG